MVDLHYRCWVSSYSLIAAQWIKPSPPPPTDVVNNSRIVTCLCPQSSPRSVWLSLQRIADCIYPPGLKSQFLRFGLPRYCPALPAKLHPPTNSQHDQCNFHNHSTHISFLLRACCLLSSILVLGLIFGIRMAPGPVRISSFLRQFVLFLPIHHQGQAFRRLPTCRQGSRKCPMRSAPLPRFHPPRSVCLHLVRFGYHHHILWLRFLLIHRKFKNPLQKQKTYTRPLVTKNN